MDLMLIDLKEVVSFGHLLIAWVMTSTQLPALSGRGTGSCLSVWCVVVCRFYLLFRSIDASCMIN